MAALHDALKALGPTDFADTPLDDLKPFLSEAFRAGQLIADSVPIAAPPEDAASPEGRSRANTTASIASSASEIELSSARSPPPPEDVLKLQKEWKAVKLNPKENPLGMGVYKLSAKDGRGSWFARRSVHEGLGFKKWKKALKREFPETMKVQGGPGEGNIRGIGGERRVENRSVEGVGKMEVYQLSAQFPGPTTPRDFVTMFLTSDQALQPQEGEDEVPRHFMVISKPCNHPDTQPREGYIRGQYESVEFIREIPLNRGPRKSFSSPNLAPPRSTTLGRDAIVRNAVKKSSTDLGSIDKSASKGETRSRGKTVSEMESRSHPKEEGGEDDESELNPIEWIMITRSDPGGSVPRFMVERGTPGGIVADASKFLNWACAKDIEDFDSDDEIIAGDDQDEHTHKHQHSHKEDLYNYQTNGHLAGLQEEPGDDPKTAPSDPATTNGSEIYNTVVNAAGAASATIASYTPAIISDNFAGNQDSEQAKTPNGARRDSLSSISTESSIQSFASALSVSAFPDSDLASEARASSLQNKELQKLEEKKRKLDEKLIKAKEKEESKRSEDVAKDEEAIRKAEEKHEREVKKQEEKYQREVEKLARKREREQRKNEERKKKAAEKDERSKIVRERDELKAEVELLRKEKGILRGQVGDLQAENTALAAKLGRLGTQGELLLKEVRDQVGKSGRTRANSLKGMGIMPGRPSSIRNGSSSSEKERGASIVPVS
ncbi:hypothetical protein B0O99DRAFT_511145 [Bisporella sp. PMI_857]|nr:hypothetical protein B0O99DRAFT_511145 [Bisporella sp. PMI_857]